MLDKTVPLFGLLVEGSVLAVGHDFDAVIERKYFRDALDQVQRVTFETVVSCKILTVIRFSGGREIGDNLVIFSVAYQCEKASCNMIHYSHLSDRNGAPSRETTIKVLFCSASSLCESTSLCVRVELTPVVGSQVAIFLKPVLDDSITSREKCVRRPTSSKIMGPVIPCSVFFRKYLHLIIYIPVHWNSNNLPFSYSSRFVHHVAMYQVAYNSLGSESPHPSHVVLV